MTNVIFFLIFSMNYLVRRDFRGFLVPDALTRGEQASPKSTAADCAKSIAAPMSTRYDTGRRPSREFITGGNRNEEPRSLFPGIFGGKEIYYSFPRELVSGFLVHTQMQRSSKTVLVATIFPEQVSGYGPRLPIR
jgi:hypothetical protein